MTEDFLKLLAERGLTGVPEELRRAYEDKTDQIEFPCAVSVEVMPSSIDGLGLFATALFRPNALLAPMRIGDKRTPAGRYTNHSDTANASVIWTESAVFLKAKRSIEPYEEVTIDYREVLGRGKK